MAVERISDRHGVPEDEVARDYSLCSVNISLFMRLVGDRKVGLGYGTDVVIVKDLCLSLNSRRQIEEFRMSSTIMLLWKAHQEE